MKYNIKRKNQKFEPITVEFVIETESEFRRIIQELGQLKPTTIFYDLFYELDDILEEFSK